MFLMTQLDGTGYFLLPLVTCLFVLALWFAAMRNPAGSLSGSAASLPRPAREGRPGRRPGREPDRVR